MTKTEHVKLETQKTMTRYGINIPLEKLPWSGEIVETKLNTGEIQLIDRMVEFALCKLHAKYFIDRYCWVYDPQKGPVPFKLFDFQEGILDSFQRHSKVIFRKCLTENNYIHTDRGYISIKDAKIGDSVKTIVGNKVIDDKIINFWENKEKQKCLQIQINNRTSIECSEDHKVLTKEGWKEAKDLSLNDELITTFNSKNFGKYEIDDDRKVALLGLMYADGKRNGTTFVNTNDDYINIIYSAGKLWEDIEPKIVEKKKQKKHHLQCKHVYLTSGLHTSKMNSYLNFAQKHGLNRLSKERSLTPELMNLNKRQMSIFINHLFAGDGWAAREFGKNKYGSVYEYFQIGIGSPSKNLIYQLREILSWYGIKSFVKRDGNFNFWRLNVSEKKSNLLFSEQIGITGKIDSEFIQSLKNSMKYQKHTNYNKIISIKEIGYHKTYDISTETQSFLANGVVVHNSRQVGASVLSGAFATWRANFNKAQIIRIISLTREDALEFKEKTVDLNYYELPGFLKAKTTRDGYSKTKLKLMNQSQIRVLSKSKNAGRGSTPSLIILDEAAFNEWMDDIWKSLEPSLDKGGDCIVISTTNGVGNWYHITYTNAEEGNNEFKPIYIPWWRYPNRSNPWLDDLLVKIKEGQLTNEELDNFVKTKEREQLSYTGSPEGAPWLWKRRHNAKSEKEFKQEILAEFLGSGETVTTVKTINRLQEDVRPPEWEDRLPSDPLQSPMPGMWVWKDVQPGHDYMITSDTATGHGKDYSTMQIIDINENEQVAEYKNQIPTDKMGEAIKKAARYYNNAFVVIETNHPGPAVFNEVYKSKIDPYQNVYARIRGKDIVGWMTTAKSRVLLIEAYFKDVENAYTKIHSSRLVDEIKVFNWSDSGKAEAMRGYNDDLIMAYAFYCHLKQEAFTAKPIGFATADTNLTHISQEFEEDWDEVERDFLANVGIDMKTYHWLQGKPLPDNYKEFVRSKREEDEENKQDKIKLKPPPEWVKAKIGMKTE